MHCRWFWPEALQSLKPPLVVETVDEYGVLNPHGAANIPMQGSVNVSVLHMFQKLASTNLCIISVDEDSMIRKKMAENWHSRDEDQTHQRLNLISFLQQKTQAGKTGFQKTKKKKFFEDFPKLIQVFEFLDSFSGPRSSLEETLLVVSFKSKMTNVAGSLQLNGWNYSLFMDYRMVKNLMICLFGPLNGECLITVIFLKANM